MSGLPEHGISAAASSTRTRHILVFLPPEVTLRPSG